MKSFLISGRDYIYTMAHRAIVKLVEKGHSPYIVDCANLLDVYFLVSEASLRGISPDIFLRKVKVARAFNPFQIVSILKKLPERSISVVFGPVEFVTDRNEGLSFRESIKVLNSLKDVIRSRNSLIFLIQDIPDKDGVFLDNLASGIDLKILINGGVIMGRTIMPYSMTIEMQRERLKKFRRALRKEDQEYLEEIFKYAKKHVQAGSYAAFPDPIIPLFLSAFIEQEKKIRELEKRIKALENGLSI